MYFPSILSLLFKKEIEPLKVPGRPKYLEARGHYRKHTDSDYRHYRLMIAKRRNKKKKR